MLTTRIHHINNNGIIEGRGVRRRAFSFVGHVHHTVLQLPGAAVVHGLVQAAP
jgi:hypothetical protein